MRHYKLVGCLSLFLGLAACAPMHQGPISDHFDGHRFHYPKQASVAFTPLYNLFVLWRAFSQNPWPKPADPADYPRPASHSKQVKVYFINHATTLIQGPGMNLLTDPVYSYRASPSQWLGPARRREPGIAFANLPPIDVVLISHNHFDHLDLPTLKRLQAQWNPLIIVPLGNKRLLEKAGFGRVKALDWWQSVDVKGTKITLLPAEHSSQRWGGDHNLTLWTAYGIELAGKRIFFAGDTAYQAHFKYIRQRWGRPDLSLLPIGEYEPRALLKREHLNPHDAVLAHKDLQSRQSLAIHFGTFLLGTSRPLLTLQDLEKARLAEGVSREAFRVINEGDHLALSRSN